MVTVNMEGNFLNNVRSLACYNLYLVVAIHCTSTMVSIESRSGVNKIEWKLENTVPKKLFNETHDSHVPFVSCILFLSFHFFPQSP